MGPDSFDCVGFNVFVTNSSTGLDISHPFHCGWKKFHDLFSEIAEEEIQILDWAQETVGTRMLDQHVSLVEDSRYVIECNESYGVQRRRIRKLWAPRFFRLRCFV
jgi:hypothetical protein